MPKFVSSKTQRINKYAWLRAPQTHPPGLQPRPHRKTMFCFSTSTYRQDGHTRHPRQPVSSLPATAGQQPFAAYLFIPAQTTSRQLATSFRLDRPVYFRSHSFYFFFLPFHSIQKRKPAKPISISFSCNPKFSPNLVQAFPSRFP